MRTYYVSASLKRKKNAAGMRLAFDYHHIYTILSFIYLICYKDPLSLLVQLYSVADF